MVPTNTNMEQRDEEAKGHCCEVHHHQPEEQSSNNNINSNNKTTTTMMTARGSHNSLLQVQQRTRDSSRTFDDLESLSSSLSVAPSSSRCSSAVTTRSLRTRLLVSFGTVVVLSLTFVVIASVLVTRQAGHDVVHIGVPNVQEKWMRGKAGIIAKSLADIESKRLEHLDGMTLLIATLTQERFMGYPLIQDDSLVPFRNYVENTTTHGVGSSRSSSSRNVYPLSAKNPLPLDWQMIPNLSAQASRQAAAEHVGRRFPWYFPPRRTQPAAAPGSETNVTATGISTADAVFAFPGSCDPSPAASPATGCSTIQNTNTFTSVPPNTTLATIHSKASDYVAPLLKSLYEYHTEVKSIELHFINHDDASSASVIFPGQHLDGTKHYTSMGCDWMNKPNPKKEGTGVETTAIGTSEQIAKCHPVGTSVSYREFNALEQDWCSAQALDPDQMYVGEPEYDPHDGFWHFVVGRAIYDPISLELLACTKITVSIVAFVGRESDSVQSRGIRTLIFRWDSGTVLAATGWQADPLERRKVHASELATFGIDDGLIGAIKMRFEHGFEEGGNVQHQYYETEKLYGSFYPFPVPRDADAPFRPLFLLAMGKTREDIGSYATTVESLVSEAEDEIIIVVVIAGLSSMVGILAVVYIFALYVTSPLQWIHRVGSQVLNTAGSNRRSEAATSQLDVNSENQKTEIEKDQPQPLWSVDRMPWTYRYAPRSEITLLVDEFHTMIKEFSGNSTANLIKRDLLEVRNPFDLSENFQSLYATRWQQEPNSCCEKYLGSFHTVAFNSVREKAVAQLPQPRDWSTKLRANSIVHHRNDPATASIVLQPTIGLSANRRHVLRSPIFWFVLLGGVLPLLLCVMGISSYVLVSIVHELPSLIWPLQDAFISAEFRTLLSVAALKGSFVSAALNLHLRDLYVVNRMTGWIYNGAIPLANTFTEMITCSEQCKQYPIGECPALQQLTCDCEWEDPFTDTCSATINESRRTQKLFFEGLSEDADANGNRHFSSFPYDGDWYPTYGTSPNTTFFWGNIASTPGTQQQDGSVDGNTTFGRLQVASALSTVMIPLYNYVQGTGLDRTWGSSVTFEADGMVAGYSGCSVEHGSWAHYQNPPNMIPPNSLCPPNKYG